MAGNFKAKSFWASWAKYNVDEGVLFKKKVEKEWQRWGTLAITLRSYKTLTSSLTQRDMTLSALCPSPQARPNRVSLGAEPTLVMLGSALLVEQWLLARSRVVN